MNPAVAAHIPKSQIKEKTRAVSTSSLFGRALEIQPADKARRVMIERCRALLIQQVSTGMVHILKMKSK